MIYLFVCLFVCAGNDVLLVVRDEQDRLSVYDPNTKGTVAFRGMEYIC